VLVEDDKRNARLALVQSVAIVLQEGLRLLGVQSPEKM
jgi:arginyl-tRNA synthetase